MIRNKFYYKVKTLIPNITQLPINILINELMNSPNYFINIQFTKYISACFDVRGKLLYYWFLNNNFCNTVCICMVMQIKLVVGVINLVEPKCQTPTYQKFYIIRCILVWNVVADELNLCVNALNDFKKPTVEDYCRENSRTFKSVCLKCNKCRSFASLSPVTFDFVIYNRNWTEWSAIWSEIQNRTSALREFGLKSQAWFRPKLHDTKFNYHIIISILKSQNLVSTNILLIKYPIC